MNASDAINALADLPHTTLIQDFPKYRAAVLNLHNGMLVAMPLTAGGFMGATKAPTDLCVIIPIHRIAAKPTEDAVYVNYIQGAELQKIVDTWTAQAKLLGMIVS